MNARTIAPLLVLLAAASAAQCPTGAPQDQDRPADQGRVSRLEAEARALARTDGCASSDQCRSAPVGARPCGGPRDYIVYCARTTDSAALYRKLDELRQAEMEFNRKTGAASTCEFRTPPGVGLEAGQCKGISTIQETK